MENHRKLSNTEKQLQIGMIGLDTSHVTAFAKLLNNKDHPYHVSGAVVKYAYPGGTEDMELSRSRLQGFSEEMELKYGVQLLSSPEEVAQVSDAILLESVDGRIHLEQFRAIAPYAKPVFIDKPLATSVQDAQEIVQLAKQYQTPLMSSSALRFAQSFTQALRKMEEELIAVDCYGPLPIEATHGYFFYGIHTTDMLFAALGRGCRSVTSCSTEDHDLIIGVWEDGRIGSIRGNRKGNSSFGALLHQAGGTSHAHIYDQQKPYYASLLEEIISFFQTGNSSIDVEETLEVIRFLEAAEESKKTGKPVDV